MEKIIWWWNMVYYFFVKWYNKLDAIFVVPFRVIWNIPFIKSGYKKRGVDNIEKTVKNAVKQAQISETYIELFLSASLSMPLIGVTWIADILLNKYGVIDGSTFFLIGLFGSLIIVFFPLHNYLLGKNDRYKEYFKEFDNMFKADKKKQRLYGLLSFLTIIALFSTIVFGFYIGDKIRRG